MYSWKKKQPEKDVSKSALESVSRSTLQQNEHTEYHIEGTVDHYKLLLSALYGLAVWKKKPLQTETEPTACHQRSNLYCRI